MKQHITEEQLNELSAKGKKKLLEYQISKDGRIGTMRYSYEYPNGKFYKRELSWLMNIGQMIEFLGEYISQWQYDFDGDEWRIESPSIDELFYHSKELCDALWQAVKEVLHEKK